MSHLPLLLDHGVSPVTLNLADHSHGGQANPTHETKMTLPIQGTSNRNFAFAPSYMKRSPRSDNLQALQGNETQIRPIEPAHRPSPTRASISSPQASMDPTPHWCEWLQPTVQFRTHYQFGRTNHQSNSHSTKESSNRVSPQTWHNTGGTPMAGLTKICLKNRGLTN